MILLLPLLLHICISSKKTGEIFSIFDQNKERTIIAQCTNMQTCWIFLKATHQHNRTLGKKINISWVWVYSRALFMILLLLMYTLVHILVLFFHSFAFIFRVCLYYYIIVLYIYIEIICCAIKGISLKIFVRFFDVCVCVSNGRILCQCVCVYVLVL